MFVVCPFPGNTTFRSECGREGFTPFRGGQTRDRVKVLYTHGTLITRGEHSGIRNLSLGCK